MDPVDARTRARAKHDGRARRRSVALSTRGAAYRNDVDQPPAVCSLAASIMHVVSSRRFHPVSGTFPLEERISGRAGAVGHEPGRLGMLAVQCALLVNGADVAE
jgi:hypothetical protein